MTGKGNDTEELEPLRLEYQNAKENIDTQREIIYRFSVEAQRLTRYILLSLAALFTGVVTIGPEKIPDAIKASQPMISGISEFSILNIAVLTLILLIISLVANSLGSAYEAAGMISYGTSEDIQNLLENANSAMSEEEFLKDRLDTYRDRIQKNSKLVILHDRLLAIGKWSLFFAIFFTASITLSAVYGPINSFTYVIVLILILIGSVLYTRQLPDSYFNPNI